MPCGPGPADAILPPIQASAWRQRDCPQCAGPAVPCPGAEPEVDRRLHLHLDSRRLALCGSGHRSVLTARRRLVDERIHDGPIGHRCAPHGHLAAGQARCFAASFRSGQPIHQRAVPAVAGGQRRHLLDEPVRQCLGQCGDGELLLLAEDRTNSAQSLSDQATKPRPMCSTTLSASTIPSAGIRRWAISALLSSKERLG